MSGNISFVRAGKRKTKGEMKMNGIPAGNIVWITWGGTLVLLVLRSSWVPQE